MTGASDEKTIAKKYEIDNITDLEFICISTVALLLEILLGYFKINRILEFLSLVYFDQRNHS